MSSSNMSVPIQRKCDERRIFPAAGGDDHELPPAARPVGHRRTVDPPRKRGMPHFRSGRRIHRAEREIAPPAAERAGPPPAARARPRPPPSAPEAPAAPSAGGSATPLSAG